MLKRLHIILALSLLALSPAWAGKLYKWTDEQGNVHYSDKLPPEAVEKAHQELNSQGLTTKSINREKTKAERMEEEAAKAAAAAEQKRIAEEEERTRARDENLLSTFTTERDLILAREDRLTSVDSSINLMVSNNATMEQQAEAVRKKIETLKKANKEVPENVTKQLENLEGQLAKNKGFIQTKQQDRKNLEAQFDADLKRYRELKGIATDTPAEQQAAEKASQEASQAAVGKDTQPPVPPKPGAKAGKVDQL